MMFRIFPDDLKIPFMAMRVPGLVLSGLFVLAAVYFIATKGLNYGVDFAGGVQMVLKFDERVEVNEEILREKLARTPVSQVSVQRFGTEFDTGDREYILSLSSDFAEESVVGQKFAEAFAGGLTEFRFSGLEKAYFRLEQDMPIEDVRARVDEISLGLLIIEEVSPFGSAAAREYEVLFRGVSETLTDALVAEFQTPDVERPMEVIKVDFVGAKVGSDLKTSALLSVLVTILLVFVYIFIRFDLIFAPGVIAALAHDVVIVAGLFALLGLQFDLTVVAALLTVAGYSINDTIVVYDRIREIMGEFRGKSLVEILDIAINQTLNRTIITSGTTVAATSVLWVFGGPVIHSFAFALTAGVIVGTLSSIFIASPIVLLMDRWVKTRQSETTRKKNVAAAS